MLEVGSSEMKGLPVRTRAVVIHCVLWLGACSILSYKETTFTLGIARRPQRQLATTERDQVGFYQHFPVAVTLLSIIPHRGSITIVTTSMKCWPVIQVTKQYHAPSTLSLSTISRFRRSTGQMRLYKKPHFRLTLSEAGKGSSARRRA